MESRVPYPLHKPEPPVTYVEEKSRKRRRWGLFAAIIMLLLMLGGANALILDAPTNHLDIDSVEMLEEALESFDGTAIRLRTTTMAGTVSAKEVTALERDVEIDGATVPAGSQVAAIASGTGKIVR